MSESLVQVSEGVGKKLHTNSRVIGANTVEDEYVIPGEYPLASYFVLVNNVSLATANDHVLQIMAGATLNVRIRYINLSQGANATAAAVGTFELWRLSTAGTGGTAVTPRPLDTADAAAGATAMTLPTAKGTESIQLIRDTFQAQQTSPASPGTQDKTVFEWRQQPGMKPIIIPAGAANGIAIKTIGALASATVSGWVELVETSFAG